jgi:hypothetical protein
MIALCVFCYRRLSAGRCRCHRASSRVNADVKTR